MARPKPLQSRVHNDFFAHRVYFRLSPLAELVGPRRVFAAKRPSRFAVGVNWLSVEWTQF